MGDEENTAVADEVIGEATEEQWDEARQRAVRVTGQATLVGIFAIASLGPLAEYLAGITAVGEKRYLATAAWLALLMTPIVLFLVQRVKKEREKNDAMVAVVTHQLSAAVELAEDEVARREVTAKREDFGHRVANALDMTELESEVIDVLERSLSEVLPDSPVELLLADNSYAHLLRVGAHAESALPSCGVDSPNHCPAARRAQLQIFADSDEFDACPKLRNRPGGAISAVCVPVSIMGHTVGVVHSTGKQKAPLADDKVQDLSMVAELAGSRIASLRMMAETQLQAATDNLTGLLNRRSFEERISEARHDQALVTIAMADLDHFKEVNDSFGHGSGDRALRVFTQVLTESVRTNDLVCRYGGEEFVVALPGCGSENARGIFDALRTRLDAAITVAGLPKFSVSFGIVEAAQSEDLQAVIGRADAALFDAKHQGRDQVVVHDAEGAIVPSALDVREVYGLESRRTFSLGR
jgi:diguanylate cyclase (GGDEF)-like protein